jgi:inorganic triphosphatase YgiF
MEAAASEPREVETALVVVADEPTEALERVAELRELGGRRLVPIPEQTLEDTYYDRPAGPLGQRSLALRLRRVNGELRLTLKSDLERHAGVADRFELEAVWSRESFAEVLNALTYFDVEFRVEGDVFSADAPSTLESLGLKPVQRRRTRRVRRLVVDDDGRALAELALDSVVFDEPAGPIRLFEVEIEARSADADVGELARALARCPSLRRWPYGKLPTGFAAARAAASGDLERLPDGTLTASAFDRLADELDELG